MISEARMRELEVVVKEASANTLRTKTSRKEFAHVLASRTGLWEPSVQAFVAEMEGLNFYNEEDKLLFLQFACFGL